MSRGAALGPVTFVHAQPAPHGIQEDVVNHEPRDLDVADSSVARRFAAGDSSGDVTIRPLVPDRICAVGFAHSGSSKVTRISQWTFRIA